MKIAIVGFASNTRILAPFHDPEWDIWGLNEVAMHMPGIRFDTHFNMHPASEIPRDHIDFLTKERESGKQVITLEDMNYEGGYYTSQVARVISYAIALGATEIGLFGVNCAASEEYAEQRACIEYWLGVAIGKGINVTLPEECPLLKGKYKPSAEGEITDAVLRERIRELEREQEQVAARFNAIGGGVVELRGLRARLTNARR